MNSLFFLLDTNVISELMRVSPEPKLLDWFEQNKEVNFFISAITRAEILLGIELLPDGKKKSQLKATFDLVIKEDFNNKCLAFDENAANEYAKVIVGRKKMGLPMSVEDAQIASIAVSKDLVLVTRNEKDFVGIKELDIINPWKND